MAHAQQAGGLSSEAKATFRRLREDPLEREHAIVHLGELAIEGEGIGTALEIGLSHRAGLTIAVSVIVDEADVLWRRDPEISYRLVATAISRLRALSVGRQEPGFEDAVARRAARARERDGARASSRFDRLSSGAASLVRPSCRRRRQRLSRTPNPSQFHGLDHQGASALMRRSLIVATWAWLTAIPASGLRSTFRNVQAIYRRCP